VTVVVEDTSTTPVTPKPAQNTLAPWRIRLAAFAVDVVPAIAVVATMALVSLTVPFRGVWWWVCIAVVGVVVLGMMVNRLLLPPTLGWSLGRALCGIAVVQLDDEPAGALRLLFRELAHLLDTASLLVGWLWPLWDPRRRTFADMLLRTEVRRTEADERLRNVRRWTAAVVLIAVGLCLGGAATSYAVIYHRDRATDETRAQIAIQGPKIVAEMLTYDPKSLRDDFARAQSLATDRYRGQLAAQQDVVQKGTPVINEYWVTDSAIQSASPNGATMLLFMQGRRGVAPGERYITATVRVSFAKDGGHWQVDDLTVLTKPKPPGNGK
jgi:Mce-associated membrane protein